jgi:exopolyphosphatase/guanosine-5'-triphosphate,3'-diphosphate pyrophosphatase
MKYGVIDIGSNSVRLMISDGVRTLYKTNKVTKLAEGVANDAILSSKAINRTVDAIKTFYDLAFSCPVDEIYIFATAAVRQSKNRQEFIDKVYNSCGVNLTVLSADEEAFVGALGATLNGTGGVIDVGGASSEVIVMKGGEVQYSKSLPIGCVKLYDMFLDKQNEIDAFLSKILLEYGTVPNSEFYAIGGTATSIASMLLELKEYDKDLVNGYKIDLVNVNKLLKKLGEMKLEERRKIVGLQPERAEVIFSGVYLIKMIMEYLNLSVVTVSESDNLEGFLKWKLEGL